MPSFLFLVVDEHVPSEAFWNCLNTGADHQFVAWTSPHRARDIVAVGCELSRWWGLKSLFLPSVGCKYLADRAVALIEQLNKLPEGHPVFFKHFMLRETMAWSGGQIVIKTVDYDKLLSQAREEQRADTLKRLADAAFAPRTQDQSEIEYLISSQALFWFTEIPHAWIDFDWFIGTRFVFELYGASISGLAPDIRRIKAKPNVEIDDLRSFLADFVCIPPGTYTLGSSDKAEQSEPPADHSQVFIPLMYMFRRPVTWGDWTLFCEEPLDHVELNSLPVTNCNAFEALIFAEQVQNLFRSARLIGQKDIITLPTEQQWEAAARGPDGFEYPWGNEFEHGRCNCDLVCGPSPSEPGRYSPAGDSAFGCQDMAGNVREWTRSYAGIAGVDWQRYRDQQVPVDLKSLMPTDRLIVRGGSYSYDPSCVKCWVRNTQLASRRDLQTGFRLVIEKG